MSSETPESVFALMSFKFGDDSFHNIALIRGYSRKGR
jgi:hypothetical protein